MRWWGQFAVRLCPWDPAQLGFKAAHARRRPQCTYMPAHAHRLRQCRLRAASSSRPPERGRLPNSCSPKQTTQPSTPESSTSTPPQTILWCSSAHGDAKCRLRRRPCSAKPQPPSPSRRGSRGVSGGRGVGQGGVAGGCSPAPGAPGPGAGAPRAPAPPLLQLERFQSRGAASVA